MKIQIIFAFLVSLILTGCGTPGGNLFQKNTRSDTSGGTSEGTGGSGGSSSTSDGPGGSGGSGNASSTSSSGGGDETGGGTSSSTGSGCVPNGCPSVSYCGDWNDGCGHTVQCKVEGGDPCPNHGTCGSNHQCNECVPTQTPDVVCKAHSCGQYVDDCGGVQQCIPTPNDGGQGCPDYQFCSTGDLPWVPNANPIVDANHVGTCEGCSKSAVDYCGVGSNTIQCPSTYFNQVQDGTETDVDCGGFNPVKCGVNKGCLENSDCLSEVCTGRVCKNSNFTNPDACTKAVDGTVCCPD